MKIFAALKLATFAQKLLASVGLDLNVLSEAGDENALKAHVEAAVAKGGDEKLKARITELEGEIEAAAEENAELSTRTASIGASANHFTVLNGALSKLGFAFAATDPNQPTEKQIEAAQKAIESHFKIRSGDLLARTGHKPLAEAPGDAGAKTMTRTAFSALQPKDAMAFVKGGGRITD